MQTISELERPPRRLLPIMLAFASLAASGWACSLALEGRVAPAATSTVSFPVDPLDDGGDPPVHGDAVTTGRAR